MAYSNKEPPNCNKCKDAGFPNEKIRFYDTGKKKPDGSKQWGLLNLDGSEHHHKSAGGYQPDFIPTPRSTPNSVVQAYNDNQGIEHSQKVNIPVSRDNQPQTQQQGIKDQAILTNIASQTEMIQRIKEGLDNTVNNAARFNEIASDILKQFTRYNDIMEPLVKRHIEAVKEEVEKKGFPTAADLVSSQKEETPEQQEVAQKVDEQKKAYENLGLSEYKEDN